MMDTKKIGIAIIAPGGYVLDSSLEKGIDSLKSRGYRVFNYYDPEKRYQRFSATDEERVQQIVQAYDDYEKKQKPERPARRRNGGNER